MKKNNFIVLIKKTGRRHVAGLFMIICSLAANAQPTGNTLLKKGRIYVGGTASGSGLNSNRLYGGSFGYTHPITKRFGLTGNADILFGGNNTIKNTNVQFYGGLSILPNNNKISFSPHLLAGIVNQQSKYKFETTSFKNKGTDFSLAIGTNVSIPINDNTVIVAKADYNPYISTHGKKDNFQIGLGINLNTGTKKAKTAPATTEIYSTNEKFECKASENTSELKISLTMIEKIAKSVEEIANKIPRVEAKVNIRSEVTVKRGEECCSNDKPPATFTEIKGGVEGGYEVNVNLWGLPDLNYSLKIWPILFIAQFQCKLFTGPTGKISLEPVGKFYGDLFGEKRPDCKACFFWNLKGEGFVRIGVKAGGKVNLYHWSPLGNGVAGFDVTGEPDETFELSAEASASLGQTFSGTYASDAECVNPPQGLHGVFKLGRAKANLKFSLKLGPLSFEPNFEVNLFDGFELKF